jgi:hypothetical protein
MVEFSQTNARKFVELYHKEPLLVQAAPIVSEPVLTMSRESKVWFPGEAPAAVPI